MQNNIVKSKAASRILLILALAAVLALTAMTIGAAPDAGDGIDGGTAKAPASVNRSYIVLMALDAAVNYGGELNGLAATEAAEGADFDASSAAAEAYAAYSVAQQDAALAAAGVSQAAVTNRYSTVLNGFSAIMSADQARAIARQPNVAIVLKDQWRQPHAQRGTSVQFTEGIQGAGEFWQTGLTGENVIVGVIDTGIWPEHPSFADNGSYSDLGLALEDTPDNPSCNIGNQAHNINDIPFTCNDKLLGARQMLATYRSLVGVEPFEFDSARDENGHGTHTASTAAGNANVPATILDQDRGLTSGVAPRARVIAYKGLGPFGGYTSDLASAIDQAVADGVDVINYSIGGGAGEPGADEFAFLNANAAGVRVATSAGNSGPGPATVGNPGTSPWITTVGANAQNKFYEGVITLGDGRQYVGASITPGVDSAKLVDAATAGGDLCLPGTLDPALVADNIVLCRRGGSARADKSRAVYMAGGAGMIMYENSDDNSLFSDTHWVPSSHIDLTPGLEIKAYAAGQMYPYATYIPAIAGSGDGSAEPMPVKPQPTAMIAGLGMGDWTPAPSMTFFSSRGPNAFAADIIKPDITAPGIQILAGNSPAPDESEPYKVPGELFQAIAGTSMSSPQVAGLFALYDQMWPADPASWSQSALMTTANPDVRDNDRVSQATPFGMGSGHAAPGHAQVSGSFFQAGLVYNAGLYDYFGYLCEMYPAAFANPVATCATLEGLGYPTTAANLNYPSMGIANLAGSQTIVRTVTSVALTGDPISYTADIAAPAGMSVSVSPESFALAPLESASFEVTISNESAALGEWAFGALTWNSEDGVYSVRSPIAVNPSLFGYPTSISDAGEAVSGSFDVSFGYTGTYEAAGHGLVPATVTSDNVLQDPDQEFDPTDGYSNMHEFDVAGAAFLRFAMPEDATEVDADLDLFLFFEGEQIASSGAGGTNELIDVTLPADGVYTLYVHGWAAPGGDSDYDLYSWIIPAAPGGSLMIDAQPEDAAIGTTGTIEFSWQGAGAEWYLGAVSHAGAPAGEDAALLGLTLINADNRP